MQASIEQLNLQRIVKRCVLLYLSTSKLPSTQQIFLELSKAHSFLPQYFTHISFLSHTSKACSSPSSYLLNF